MTSQPNKSFHIVVIGAGITALQTSLYLQSAGHTVTIIAEHTPGDEAPLYASPWAGAQWRSHAKSDEVEERGWEGETYREWMDLVRKGEGEARGLGIVPSTVYWSAPISETNPQIWWRKVVEDFQELPISDLPKGMRSGARFRTICINVPRHLQRLFDAFQAAGGRVIKARLRTDEGFPAALKAASAMMEERGLGKVGVFVNATGMGAKELVGDEAVFPVKGQTVLVKGESKFAVTQDENRYVIPRPGSGTTILGGTRELGIWDTSASEQVTGKILEGCKELAPELFGKDGGIEVLSVQCGLRPARKGGPRVEHEFVGESTMVVHAYGHAGAGYQDAVGSARKVVRLVEELDLPSSQ